MQALLICNGLISNSKIIHDNLKKDTVVICCDGGAKYAFNEGILPNYIIGDLDSLDLSIISFFQNKGVCFKKFSSDKDKTDTQLAIEFAKTLNISSITILGAIGNRFDHTLTNVHMLLHSLNNNIDSKIIDDNNEIILINKYTEINGDIGDLLSLIPFSSDVFGVTTTGLKYQLNNFNFKIGTSIGISNVFKNQKVTINLSDGYLLVIKSKD